MTENLPEHVAEVLRFSHAHQSFIADRTERLERIARDDAGGILNWLETTLKAERKKFGKRSSPLQAIMPATAWLDAPPGDAVTRIYDLKHCAQTLLDIASSVAHDDFLYGALQGQLGEDPIAPFWVETAGFWDMYADPGLECVDAYWGAYQRAFDEVLGHPPAAQRHHLDACVANMKKAPRARGAFPFGSTVVPFRQD
ncbi:MAG: hypothetical protein AAGI03_11900 [Pseudomonadota bacterium]